MYRAYLSEGHEEFIRHKLLDMATKLEASKEFNKEIVSKMM